MAAPNPSPVVVTVRVCDVTFPKPARASRVFLSIATMNGSGPTVPRVNDQELYSVLCQGVSQDASLLDSSTKAMASMANDRFGTFDTLQRIAAQKDVPLPVRQLAILQFKNHALGHWRSRKCASPYNGSAHVLCLIERQAVIGGVEAEH
jgi:hypothetical protein